MLGERVPNVCHRAGAVVGQAVDDDRRAGHTVALVADFFIVDAFQTADAALDGALHRVLGHVAVSGFFHGQPQPRVHGRVAAAHLGGHGDFLDQPREERAALGVLAALAVLNVGPLGMACHARILWGKGGCLWPGRDAPPWQAAGFTMIYIGTPHAAVGAGVRARGIRVLWSKITGWEQPR